MQKNPKNDNQFSGYEQTDLEQLFNKSNPTDFLVKDTKKESDFYNPSLKFAKNGKNYVSRIKFIPYIPNPKVSILDKWVIYLQNPVSGNRYIDCPSTVNQPSILQQLYFLLKNSENAADKKLSENFSRRRVFFSLVQIISDDNRPELEGKIKIFKYGQKLYNRLDKLMNPKKEVGSQPHNNIFDIFNGRALDLDIKIKAGYNDYEDCDFSINPEPFRINGEVIKKDPKNYKLVADWVVENSPDLMQAQFKQWDDETLKFVMDTIEASVMNRRLIQQLYKKNNININFNPNNKTIQKNIIEEDTDDVDDNIDETDIINQRTKKLDSTFNKFKTNITRNEEYKEDDNDDDDDDEIEQIMSNKKNKNPNTPSIPRTQKNTRRTVDLDDESLYEGL